MKVKLKRFGLVFENLENMPSSIVPKPPKPGFVSFGAIDLAVIWSFVWVGQCRDTRMLADIPVSFLLERIRGGQAKTGDGCPLVCLGYSC